MAGIAVFLGFWISNSSLSFTSIVLLVVSAFLATGFGNVINDLVDIKTDCISHPDRPLPKGEISIRAAKIYLLFLLCGALVFSYCVSITHGNATLIPLGILIFYSFYLKGTPLAGNFVVASLVAYPLLYGGLGAPDFTNLITPAILAFLLNISREIVKDLQDKTGDQIAGYRTTASISAKVLRRIIYVQSLLYISVLVLTIITHLFGMTYTIICLGAAIPVHILRTIWISQNNWESKLSKISGFFKIEMLIGLVALTADHLFTSYFFPT